MLAVYAEQDCARLAAEIGIPFLDKGQAPPVEHRRALIDALADGEQLACCDQDVLEAIALYWRGDAQAVARRLSAAASSGRGDLLLQRSQKLMARLGHYDAATIHYAGEWYWGVDRLHYLTDRLDALGVRKPDASASMLASLRQAGNDVAAGIAAEQCGGAAGTGVILFGEQSIFVSGIAARI